MTEYERKKQASVMFYVSDEEKALFVKASHLAETNLSDYCRQVLLEKSSAMVKARK